MKCDETRELLLAHLDRETRPSQDLAIEAHLSGCADCRAERDALDETRDMLQQAFVRESRPRRRWHFAAAAAALLAVIGLYRHETPTAPVARATDVLVDAPLAFHAGASGGLRVGVFSSPEFARLDPVGGEPVQVLLGSAVVFDGVTGADGAAHASFQVPDLPDGEYPLTVRAAAQEFTQIVAVKRDARIMLSTDKPLYQPLQPIQMSALALDTATLVPLQGELTFEVEDPRGNKVYKHRADLSAYGRAAAEFQLADEVNFGTYNVRATCGAFEAERSVEVKKYVLPKFRVKIEADKEFYLPGETIRGSIDAQYVFDKPVTGEVKITASKFDVEWAEFATWNGSIESKTEFEIALPGDFAGQPIMQGDAVVKLDVRVTDTADHSERVERVYPVTDKQLDIGAVPESGRIVVGVENLVYIVTSTPDGKPAEADVIVTLGASEHKVRTNDAGYAEVRFAPRAEDLRQAGDGFFVDAKISAATARGERAEEIVVLGTEPIAANLLLRLDRGIYRAGDPMDVTLLSTFRSGRAFLDVTRAGQTLLTTSLDIAAGRGSREVVLGPEIFGAVEVHAYVLTPEGNFIRDSKVVYVEPAQELNIAVTSAEPVYRPGDAGAIRFHITDAEGNGVPAALGVIVVDEAVYALQDAQPGLARVFFTLEQELAKPKWQIKYGDGDIGAAIRERRDGVAKILMSAAEVTPIVAKPRWRASTLPSKYTALASQVQEIYAALHKHIVTDRRPFLAGRALDPSLLSKAGADGRRDPWDRPLTLEALRKLNAQFTARYWADVIDAEKYARIAQALTEYARDHDALAFADGNWSFRPGVLEALALAREDLVDAFGDPIALDRFDAATIAHNARELRLSALHKEMERAVFDGTTIVEQKDGAWRYEEPLGLQWSNPVYATELTGASWDLNGALAKLPAFDPAQVPSWKPGANLSVIDSAVCGYFHSELKRIPEDPLNKLVEAGKVTREAILDSWGHPMRLVQAPTANAFGCDLLDGRDWAFQSAGPDGVFGSGDDYADVAMVATPGYEARLAFIPVTNGKASQGFVSDSQAGAVGVTFEFESVAKDSIDFRLWLLPTVGADYNMQIGGAVAYAGVPYSSGNDADDFSGLRGPGLVFLENGRVGFNTFATMVNGGKHSLARSFTFGQATNNNYAMETGPGLVVLNSGSTEFYDLGMEPTVASLRVDGLYRELEMQSADWGRLGIGGRFIRLDDLRTATLDVDFNGDVDLNYAYQDGAIRDLNGDGKADGVLLQSGATYDLYALPNTPASIATIQTVIGGTDAGAAPGRVIANETPELLIVRLPKPRVRAWFPETLLWVPELVTDEHGGAVLPLTNADSITTWRITASANSAAGRLGSTVATFRVFQDFFVDIDFPVALTQNDTVSVPVSVYNYMKEDQTVRLKVLAADWYELLDEAEKTVEMKPGEVKSVYFTIRAKGLGRRDLTVEAHGTKLSDAIRRTVEVVPDGKRVEVVLNDRLDANVARTIEIPVGAVVGASKIVCKCYPGIFSQVLEGIDGMLGAPHG